MINTSFSYLIVNSKWLSGSINGKYNLIDINQTSGKLIIDNFTYNAGGQSSIAIQKLSAEVANMNNKTSIVIKTNIQ